MEFANRTAVVPHRAYAPAPAQVELNAGADGAGDRPDRRPGDVSGESLAHAVGGSPTQPSAEELRANHAGADAGRMQVVVVGGGIAGAEALLAIRDLAGDRVELTLVSPDPDFVHRPLAVAEPFGLGHVERYPLGDLAERVGARWIRDALAEVDEAGRRVILGGGGVVSFDALVVAIGARTAPALDGATTWFPEGDRELYAGLLRDVEEGYVRRLLFAIPPGAVWPLPLYELAMMTAREAAGMGMSPEITVTTPEAVPLAVFGTRAAKALAEELEAAGIRLETATVARVEARGPYSVVLQPSVRRIEVDRVIAIPAVVGPRVPGLSQNAGGFIPVERDGRVRGSERVWAAGDGIAYPVKYGGLATQQADLAATGIARLAGATVPDPPRHLVLRGMLMTGARPRALGAADPSSAGATPIWAPERKVHGRYLSDYLEGSGTGPARDSAPAGVAIEELLPGLGDDAP